MFSSNLHVEPNTAARLLINNRAFYLAGESQSAGIRPHLQLSLRQEPDCRVLVAPVSLHLQSEDQED